MAIGKKIKLCLNSNIADQKFIDWLLRKHKVLTSQQLIPNNPSPTDEEIIKEANIQGYHILTSNTKHFKKLFCRLYGIKVGVIGINTEYSKIYDELNFLLTKKIISHETLQNKFYEIDLEGFSATNKEGNTIIPKTFW